MAIRVWDAPDLVDFVSISISMTSYSMAKGASVKVPKGAGKCLMRTDTEHNCHTVFFM
jgi:hypothetical protein